MIPRMFQRSNSSPVPARRWPGFTLVELMLSISLLCLLLIGLNSMLDMTRGVWRQSRNRVDEYQTARTALEILSREVTPAVVDTRMQFAIVPGKVLTNAGATLVGKDEPALLWMAPQGENGTLQCLGYYLYRDPARKFYRLKRICIPPTLADGSASPYYPQLSNPSDSKANGTHTSPYNADWFTHAWDASAFDEESSSNTAAVVSTVADGVVAFWVQPIDALGNPIPQPPVDPTSPGAVRLYYNSAAYFEVATSTPFDDGTSFAYVAPGPQAMKANRVPAFLSIAIVTLDADTLGRVANLPEQKEIQTKSGALDLDASLAAYQADLQNVGVYKARTFTARVRLINGS